MTEFTVKPIRRRKSIQLLLGFSFIATIGGVLAPIIAYLIPRENAAAYGGPSEVGAPEDFPLNSGKIVSVNDKPVIIVNTKAGGLKAFSAICTHLGCVVTWNERKGIIHSPCHDGLFNPVNGSVISGPPPRPLPQYELVVKEGKVLVGKPLGNIYGERSGE
ncbi:MAG: Rieske (2Fe-2S) protein [Chloroflexi bacterium]|nr:Rieske (2Fe-2S) protein [Chloroflexota bacterium]